MNPKELGERILRLRKEAGMTQKELASILCVTDGAVSKWERGLNYPDLSVMGPLAAALHTDMLTLLGLEGATGQQVARTLSDLSVDEKNKLVKDLRQRCILNIGIGYMLFASLFLAGYIFHKHGIYGMAQTVTIGMLGFTGTLVGSEWYFFKSLRSLHPKK